MQVSDRQFPVVGIGASAGGLEAIKELITLIPKKSGMSYVFVQHLSPDYVSFLPEILEKTANIPVHKITDDINLEPDNLYVIPENKIVTAYDGALKLAPMAEHRHKVKVIDVFFSSLAVVHQSYAVGIVLSGTLDDGTLGLKLIKAYGGLTFAQDEASAAFDAMPKSAISMGVVDFVLPPAKIAEQLLTINHIFPNEPLKKESGSNPPEKDEEIFKQLLTVLRVRRGVDFTYYKEATLKRRIIRRMALTLKENPSEYLEYLRENKTEQDGLYNDLLISVTQFFRDPPSFDILCNVVLPIIVKQKGSGEPIRIWVAGCATGEEAYSMAICLREHIGEQTPDTKVQIFATDISENAIAKARNGTYKQSDLEGLSTSRLQRFFTKLDGSFQVNKEIRDMCVFANHNFLKDPPFSKIDLVSCRNVLIYMEPILQKRALTTFHYSLNQQGYLMLGKSESILSSSDMFAPSGGLDKIFRRKGGRGRFMQVASLGNEETFKEIDKPLPKADIKNDIFKTADAIVLSKHAPPGLLVNEHFDIVQFRGKTETWIAPSPGEASLDVLKMVRGGLAFELRNLLFQAKKTNANARKDNILFRANDADQYVHLDVTPVAGAEDTHYLILFENGLTPQTTDEPNTDEERENKSTGLLSFEIDQLKKGLLQARIDMRTITEEQEAVNEELQSANQELRSGSEELQSLNEELETSTEELQSTNEEVMIVNAELIDRNKQLNNARIYAEAIINTIRDPLIILDRNLIVKRATDGFYQTFSISEKDAEGTHFYEMGNRQWDIPSLRVILESVLREKKSLTDFELTHVFPTIGRKIMHLNTRHQEWVDGEQLILLAIEDITAKRKVEEGLADVERLLVDSKERLKLAIDSAGLGTWDFNLLTRELIWDSRSKEIFGLDALAAIDYSHFVEFIHPEDKEMFNEKFTQAVVGENGGEFDREFRIIDAQNNKLKWVKVKGKVYFNEVSIPYRFVGTILDVTAQKVLDEATRELIKRKDDFMSIASHELKTPLTSLKASLQLLSRMKDDPSETMSGNLIDLANKNVNKINNLVEELLNVSRLNEGQLRLNKKDFVLSKLIEEGCGSIGAEGGYNLKIEGNIDLKVHADPDRIEQVLVNFVNNAVKYAPDSKDIIVIISEDGNQAKISVRDNGPGIDPEHTPRLFDRYYRIQESGERYSGLGLGLYISSEIIRKHGGEIGVKSEPGHGSTFWFTLPL
jgi:two-component system, chemotaxis family, CheB/CheR fusion protein